MEKFASGLVAVATLVGCYLQPALTIFLPVSLLILIPLTLIWFSGELGSWAGPTGRGFLRVKFPSLVFRLTGWLLLILLAAVPIAAAYVHL